MANIRELILSIESDALTFDEKLAALTQVEETLVAMQQQEEDAVQENVDLIVEAIKVMQDKVDAQVNRIADFVPEKGEKGDKGDRGLDGRQGVDGKDGRDGVNGQDGKDGADGISVTDAKIDFDGSLIITLSTGKELNVGEVVAPDLAEKIKLVTSGGAGTVLPTQTGNSGKYLTTDGSALSWGTVSGGGGGVSSVASADGSVTVTTVSGAVDLSVAVAASTTNVICQVRNTTGSTLTKGTAVYISGATGQIPTVSKALATSDATSAQTLGLMTADLANNSNGYVTVIGLIANINTSAYSDGDQLYLSGVTAGTLTATKTYAPTHLVYVAVVEHAHPTQGKLFVKVQNGYEMDELHNVSAQSPSNGDILVYNTTTSLWEKIQNTTGTVTSVAATVPSFLSVSGSPITTSGTLAIALASTPTNGQLLIGNGTGFSYANLTAGSNITITNSAGGISIASSGSGGSSLPITKMQAQSFGGF